MSQTKTIEDFLANVKEDSAKDVGKLLFNLSFEPIEANSEIKNSKGNIIGEIDFIFKYDEYLFLIEVTKRKDRLTEKIDHFFARWVDESNLDSMYQKHGYEHLKTMRIFFSLSERRPKKEHASRLQWLNHKNKCFIIYLDDFLYFQDSYKVLGKWAVNDFLNFIEFPKSKETRRIPAIQFYIGDTRAFSFSVKAIDLLNSAYIFRRLRNGDIIGYQRALNPNRIEKISKSITNRETIAFPNSILIKGEKFLETPLKKPDCPSSVKINFPIGRCSCRIIDGQHRILAFARASKEIQESHSLPVIGFDNLSTEDETRMFIDINSTQKRVDVNLLLYLRKDFVWKENTKPYYQATAVKICEKLNENSSLRDKIYFGTAIEKKTGKIKLNTLVSVMLQSNLIGGKHHFFQKSIGDIDGAFDKINKVFRKLFNSIRNNESMVFFLTNQGIRILFRMLQVIERNKIKKIVSISESELFEGLIEIMSKSLLGEIRYLYGGGGASRATKRVLKELRKAKNEKFRDMVSELNRLRIYYY